jgi:hypothetical protein
MIILCHYAKNYFRELGGIMKFIKILNLTILIFSLSASVLSASSENLDELINRKARYVNANWGKGYLEHPSTFVWQPETVCYSDVTTGREIWVLVHGPDEQSIYSKEYATNAWSYDGSTLGVWIPTANRASDNPIFDSWFTYYRWLVKADGSYLKVAEGYGPNDIPEAGFGWAHTENAYYAFGSLSTKDTATHNLCKMTVDNQNIVNGSVVLDTANASGGDVSKGINPVKKGIIKNSISADDEWLSCSARFAQDYGRTISCYGHMRVKINKGVDPAINDYWGINRDCHEYGDHENPVDTPGSTMEKIFHGGGNYAFGFDHEQVIGLYGSHVWFLFDTTGSDTDGGPKWEDWDGDSYGGNEIIPISTGRTPEPEGYHQLYWGHPSFDKWQKYILWGCGDPKPGTRITRVIDGVGFDGSYGQIAGGISSYAQYDGRHHAWDGWTDNVVFFPYKIGNTINNYEIMYGRQIDFSGGSLGDAYQICSTHLDYQGNYNAYPRPSQSPDGTKVAFAAHWLNSSDQYPYLNYAVAIYPHPPEITQASASSGNVTVRFDWRLSAANPRGYTTRGWPDESNDIPPAPRETKLFRLWRSPDNANWSPVGVVDANIFDRFDFVNGGFKSGQLSYWEISDSPGPGTWHYAVTSQEHSGLESRSLSNVWKVSLNSSGSITETTQAIPYPSNPGSIKQFYNESPPSPANVTVTKKSTPGHYQITWNEPNSSYVRYYNIYYSTSEEPPADQKFRIASVPKGTSRWLDWCADPSSSAFYKVTSVDYQANESANKRDTPPSPEPPGAPSAPANLQVIEQSN